jgi:hypothetical protein
MVTVRVLVTFCLLILPRSLQSQSRVMLDRLSDCEGLAKTLATLKKPPSRHCRDPRGSIEKKLISPLVLSPNVQTCILTESPPQLAGFTCVDTRLKNTSGLTCFKATDNTVLDDFVQHFDSVFSDKVANYERSAKACPVGNGHFATVESDLFPGLFRAVAKPRFGFGLGIDSSSQVRGQAYHGFADIDPDLTASPNAIEIFDMFQTDQIEPQQRDVLTESVDVFNVETDNMKEFRQMYADAVRKATGYPVVAKARMVALKYQGKEDVETARRRGDLDEWQQGISSVLEDAGFRELTKAELAAPDSPVHNVDDLRDAIVKGTLIANRQLTNDSLGPHISVLTTDNKRCWEFAYVIVIEPVNDVKVDYGGFMIMLLGVGTCGPSQNSSGILSEQRLDETVEYLRGQL